MHRLFGTNGVRGVVNEGMTPELALRLGKAIGSYFEGNIVIATDTRTANEMLKDAVISGIISTGNNVFDAGIAPSPALQYYVKNSEANAGVIITASHNPANYDGIKVIDEDGTELERSKEEKIEKFYFNEKFKKAAWNKIGKVYDISILDFYIEGILDLINIDAIKEKEFKVVVDCGNGAGSYTMPYLLGEIAKVVSINAHPDGNFSARPPEPTPANLQDLISFTKNAGADVGIAYDGDADRAIFVDEKGNYIYGDKTLAVLSGYKVEKKKGIVVTPVSTSSCVEDYVKAKGGKVVYTKVGAPIVARKMKELNAIFGGEENGGLIFPEHQYCRDAGMSSVAMLELMATKEKKLSELVEEVPDYSLVKTKLKVEKKEKLMEKIKKEIKENVDLTDGIKIFLDDAWVLIRPSGTEPIIRIYAEAKNETRAKQLAEKYKNFLKDLK